MLTVFDIPQFEDMKQTDIHFNQIKRHVTPRGRTYLSLLRDQFLGCLIFQLRDAESLNLSFLDFFRLDSLKERAYRDNPQTVTETKEPISKKL